VEQLFRALELTLSVIPRYISVFCGNCQPLSFSANRGAQDAYELTQHVLNLPPHGQHDENEPVENQHGPEDGQVEDLAPRATERQHDGARRRVPELELGQPAHEWLELFVRLGGQVRAAFFHAFVGF